VVVLSHASERNQLIVVSCVCTKHGSWILRWPLDISLKMGRAPAARVSTQTFSRCFEFLKESDERKDNDYLEKIKATVGTKYKKNL
jgi:hypothetical protein